VGDALLDAGMLEEFLEDALEIRDRVGAFPPFGDVGASGK